MAKKEVIFLPYKYCSQFALYYAALVLSAIFGVTNHIVINQRAVNKASENAFEHL